MAAILTVVFIYIRIAGTEAFTGSEEIGGADSRGVATAQRTPPLLQTRRLSVGSRAWEWVRRNGFVIYAGLAIAYMLIPIALIVVFSFDDARQGKFNFTWQRIHPLVLGAPVRDHRS